MKFRPMTEVKSATAGSCCRIVLGLLHDFGGAPDRGAFRQLNDNEKCALIVLGQEARRRDLRKADDAAAATTTRQGR